MPEHGKEAAACDVLPEASKETRTVLIREGLIFGKLMEVGVWLEDHNRPREPVNIYAHIRPLPDLNWSLGTCAKRLYGLAFIESLRSRPVAAILSCLMAHGGEAWFKEA